MAQRLVLSPVGEAALSSDDDEKAFLTDEMAARKPPDVADNRCRLASAKQTASSTLSVPALKFHHGVAKCRPPAMALSSGPIHSGEMNKQEGGVHSVGLTGVFSCHFKFEASGG